MADKKSNGKKKSNDVKDNRRLSDEKLAEMTMQLFGRKRKQFPFLSEELIKEALDIDLGRVAVITKLLMGQNLILALDAEEITVFIPYEPGTLEYTPAELVTTLSPRYFDKFGARLKKLFEAGKSITIDAEFFEENSQICKIPKTLIRLLLGVFEEAGLVQEKEGSVRLTNKGKQSKLGYDILKRKIVAGRFDAEAFEGLARADSRPFTDFGKIVKAYEQHNQDSELRVIQVETGRLDYRIQHIAEILFGHQDLDLGMLENVMKILEGKPAEEIPDVLIISGAIQGGFQRQDKNRRRTLAVKSEKQQFSAAHLFIERCLQLGVKKLIYNMSDDDIKYIEQSTVTAMMIIGNQSGKSEKTLTYYQIDRLKQQHAWDFHFWFEANVVFEYQLRCGRRLYSAGECLEKFGVEMEEYLMLLEVYENLVEGTGTAGEKYSSIVEVDNIPLTGKRFDDFEVTDDFILEIVLADGSIQRIHNKHNFNLTTVTMLKDPLRTITSIVGQRTSQSGSDPCDMYAILGQHLAAGTLINSGNDKDGIFLTSFPSMQAFADRRRLASSVSRDTSHRKATTRRDYFMAGAVGYGKTSDGIHRLEFYDRELLRLMDVSSERVAVAVLSDWQTGSTTMRPDMQIRFLDYLNFEILPRYKTHLILLGDLIQGKNYPEFSVENRHIGLTTVDDQLRFAQRFMRNSYLAVPKDSLSRIQKVSMVAGNHEAHSGWPWPGTANSLPFEYLFEIIEREKGIKLPFKFYEMPISSSGDVFRAWSGFENIAGYGVLFQHKIMDKRGNKGQSGPAVLQAKTFLEGLGGALSRVNIGIFGHWHQPQYYMSNDKLFVVNGSLAGLSGFEYGLGHQPVIASVIMYLGGNKPPVLEIITEKKLISYIPQGYYSSGNLKKLGLEDDANFDPLRHGAFNRAGPQSAIHKALWRYVEEINSQLTPLF